MVFRLPAGARARLTLSVAMVSLAIGCRHASPLAVATLADAAHEPLPCLGSSSLSLTWIRSAPDERLDRWCAQAGPPLLALLPPAPATSLDRLLVVTWNVHVGGGRVIDLVESLRQRERGRAAGFVLLLQEAYRRGGDIGPPRQGDGVPGGIRPSRPSLDVDALGRYLGMSVAYVPSMRNGRGEAEEEPEDRGSAVLSTEPLSDIRAIELPFGKQRRVAVMATVTPRGGFAPLRVVAAHLDTFWFGGQRRQAEALALRINELKRESTVPVIAGVDTNARNGVRDATVRTLAASLPLVESCGHGSTVSFLRVDFMFSDLAPSLSQDCRTLPPRFGSDHRPIVLAVSSPGLASWLQTPAVEVNHEMGCSSGARARCW